MTDDAPTLAGQPPVSLPDAAEEPLVSAGARSRGSHRSASGVEPAAHDTAEAPVVAGYDLVRLIGRGGMGMVWEAIEHRFDRRVALKVHARATDADDDLWYEALVAAKIGDPSIVRVLEVGRAVCGRPFYAMELVPGTDLAALLADGPLPPLRAVAIAADIARAAAAAHELGVIHRDLKPRNVIIDPTGRARVLDFGVAFSTAPVLRGELQEGAAHQSGVLAGSPSYMAPEQVVGGPVLPQTDIFAIGVILFEMLTGKRPFEGPDTDSVLLRIATEEAVMPSSKNAAIHEDLDTVVGRCLARDPAARFSTARHLFEALTALSEGRSVAVEPATSRSYVPKVTSAPPARPHRREAAKHLAWRFPLAAPPEAVWPYVSNTDRFNKAVGLAPVSFFDRSGENGPERIGEFRIMGVMVRWQEFPFEWVKNREHSVFRWYSAGPLEALWNRVSLTPRSDGGTDLVHEVWLTPRGVFGQVAAFVEVERKFAAAIDRFYHRLDAILARGGNEDPFEALHAPNGEQRRILGRALERLTKADFAPELVARLGEHLSTAPDATVTTLRPYALADAWGEARSEVLDAMMHLAEAGVIEPAWDVICPRCMVTHESRAQLKEVQRVAECRACAKSFERDLQETVELVFVPHPSVRSVERATYCAGSPAQRAHVFAQQLLEPGEERRITVDIPRGRYKVSSGSSEVAWELVSSAVGFQSAAQVVIEDERVTGKPAIVRAGEVELTIVNEGSRAEPVRLERADGTSDGVPAAAALTHPSFRSFFPDQLVATNERLRVSHLAFVFLQLVGREELCHRLGDAAAFEHLAEIEARIDSIVQSNEGTPARPSLDVLVFAFATAQRALKAALAMRAYLADGDPLLEAAIAAHDGRSLALTRDGRPEFFGETLLRGQSLLHDCPRRGIAMSASFAADHGVMAELHGQPLAVHVGKSGPGPYAGRRITSLAPASDVPNASVDPRGSSVSRRA